MRFDKKTIVCIAAAAAVVLAVVAAVLFFLDGVPISDNVQSQSEISSVTSQSSTTQSVSPTSSNPESSAPDSTEPISASEPSEPESTSTIESSEPESSVPESSEQISVSEPPEPVIEISEPESTSTSEEPAPESSVPEAPQLRFRNNKLLQQHYQKHGIDMGFASAEEYERAAAAVPFHPDVLHKIEAEDGDDVYYIESTNEFVIVSTDGYIRTYFNPDRGIDYYNRQ